MRTLLPTFASVAVVLAVAFGSFAVRADGPPTPPSPAPADAGAPGAAAASPSTVSITLTNTCKQSVSVGNGADAQSVTPSSLPSEVPQVVQFAVGETVWLFDRDGKPIARTKLGAKTKTVEVAKSCKALVAR